MAELLASVSPNVCKMGFCLSIRTSHIRQNLIPNSPVALCSVPVLNFPQRHNVRRSLCLYETSSSRRKADES